MFLFRRTCTLGCRSPGLRLFLFLLFTLSSSFGNRRERLVARDCTPVPASVFEVGTWAVITLVARENR